MSVFSEMAMEARNAGGVNPQPAQPLHQKSQAAIPAKFQSELEPVEHAAPTPAPQESVPEPVRELSAQDAARQAHEAAEANRRAEWEMQQSKKKEVEQSQLDRLAAMSDQDVMDFSVKRVRDGTERLTRRNMKECVSEHIQALCRKDPAFARLVLHPRKTMVRCFQYIYRKAQECAQQEMKDMGDTPVNGVYGIDIPDGLCYQWAEEYFKDSDVPEDKESESKFVPRTYTGAAKTSAQKTPEKKKPKSAIDGQISLLGEAV